MPTQIDYKIKSMEVEGRGNLVRSLRIAFYVGDTSAQNEVDPITGQTVSVTRYRRSRLVAEKTFFPQRRMTLDEIQKAINLKLADRAVQLGLAVIPAQTDITNAIELQG